MIRGAVVLTWTLTIVIAALGVVAMGDEGAAQQYPYIGAVTGTNVYVRSGPGVADGRNDYYQCAKLSPPANVTVVGRMNNWLKILAPQGCYSVIFAKYVDPDETSTTGVVTGDNVRIRAGGTEHEINFWQPHGTLNKGDTVKILERVTDRWGDWYKIASPHIAYFWIYAQYVTPLSKPPQDAPTASPTEPTTAPKAAPPVIPSAPKKKAPPREVKPAPPVVQDAAALLTKIKQIEKQLRAEYDKPLPQRNFKDLLAKYRRIKVADDSFAKPWLESRIEFLQNAIRKRQELAGARSIIEQTEAKQELFQMHRTQLTKDAEAAAGARGYPAEGILMASELFIGGLAHPKRFLLRDPSSLRIRAYVQSTGGKIDLNGYAGMYVGVSGPIRYDEKLAVNIIEAEKVTVIKEQARLAGPAEPTVQPRRIPRPKPARPELPPKEPATPPTPVAPEAEVAPEPEPLVKTPAVPKPQGEPVKPEKRTPAPEPAAPEPPAPIKPEPLVKKPESWAPQPPAPKVEPELPVKKPAPPVIKPAPPKAPTPVVVPEVTPTPPPKPVRHIIVPPPLEKPKMPALPPGLTPMTQPATKPIKAPEPTRPAPTTAPAPPRLTPATDPTGVVDPLPPTGLPMVSGTPEPLTATLDEREYE